MRTGHRQLKKSVRAERTMPSTPDEVTTKRRRILGETADAYFLCDVDGNIHDTNTVACRSLGYTRKELLKLSALDIVDDFEHMQANPFWKKMRTGEEAVLRAAHRRKDGSTFPVETLLTRVRLAGKDYWVVLSRKIAKRERAVAAKKRYSGRPARRGSERKTLFLANTIHEIRTPMNAVIGLTDLLLTTPLTPQQREYATTIHSSGSLLLKVVDDVLDYSALEAGRLELKAEVFDVESIVERALRMLAGAAYGKGIELTCSYRVGSFHAVGDPNRLQQVLVNLVSNAVKFTRRGEIVVEVSSEAAAPGRDWLRVDVKDTGIGIAPEDERDIFRPFTRLQTGADEAKGNGMGLAISKGLVELMGGEIGIRSRESGGTDAWFRVPLERLADHGASVPDESLAGLRVLVAEDNRKVAEAIRDCLSALKMRADIESDSRALLRSLSDEADHDPYRLVIVDSEIPGLDSLSLVRQIRSASSASIILLTSITRPSDAEAATRLGVRCLNKPALPRSLRRTLKDAVRGHRRGAASRAVTVTGSDAFPASARILIADDNPVGRRVLTDMLRAMGLQPAAVSDGPSVLEAVRHTSYDLVLLDCQMPGIDGYQVVERVRNDPTGARRPVIVAVTANPSMEERTRCLRAGMDDFLAKPLTLESLRRVLARWLPLDRKQTDRDARVARPSAEPSRPEPADLCEMFVTDTQHRLGEISELIDHACFDRNKAGRAVHALKGGCLHVGADRMGELCGQLESSIAGGDLKTSHAILDKLQLELGAVQSTTGAYRRGEFHVKRSRPRGCGERFEP